MPSSLGPAEILVILVVALIVLGPKRLPEAGRQVGKALSEVRRWSQDVKYEMNQAFNTDVNPNAAAPDDGRPRYPTEGATWISTDPVPPPVEVAPPPEAVAAVEAGETDARPPQPPAAEDATRPAEVAGGPDPSPEAAPDRRP